MLWWEHFVYWINCLKWLRCRLGSTILSETLPWVVETRANCCCGSLGSTWSAVYAAKLT